MLVGKQKFRSAICQIGQRARLDQPVDVHRFSLDPVKLKEHEKQLGM